MSHIWYISPSSQSANIGSGEYGSEQQQMNLLADEITAHLDRAGVDFHRADKALTLAQRVRQSNEWNCDFHLALHSNAGGNGSARGPIGFYGCAQGKTLAEKLVAALLALGQKNNRADNVQSGKFLYEVRNVKAVVCLLEVDFHDNPAGASFIMEQRSAIAEAIARVIIETDGRKFISEDAGSYREQAVQMGLFPLTTDWSAPVSNEKAADLAIRLLNLCKGGE